MSTSDDEERKSLKLESKRLLTLKKTRGVYKGKLTLYKKYLDALSNLQISADQLIDLEMRTNKIRLVFNEFETCQDEIETLSADYEEQLLVRDIFETEFYKAVSLAMGRLSKEKPSQSPGPSRREENRSEIDECIKYPEIVLPDFEGDIKQWIEFRDTFDAIINHSKLKPIQKYKYLRTCLKGSALEVIASLEYNEDSYDLAWKLLCERYNNPRIIISNHLKALFNVDVVHATPTALRGLLDNISKHLRTIKALNVDIENWDLLIIFFLSSKLEPTLQRKWEEKVGSKDLPTLQDFKSFLRARADLLDTLNANSPTEEKRSGTARKTFLATTQPSPRSIPANRCANCKESHYINQCPKFLALNTEARTRTIKGLRLCLNCFGNNHMIQNCRASRCRTCKGKHHTLLHDPTFAPRPYHDPKDTTLFKFQPNQPHLQPNVESPPNPKPSTSNNPVTNTSLIQPSHDQFIHKSVILSTALVNVRVNNNTQSHTLRILLDSGSQSNLITQRAFEKLNLPKYDINMEVRGFNNSLTEIKHFCNLKVQSRDDTYATDVSCFIVPTLCTLPQVSNVQSFNIPTRYKLADEHFYKASEIDMILGAEQFYNILCVGQHRLGNGLPILQKTRFGWIVSGPFTLSQPTKSLGCNFVLNDYKPNNELIGSLWDRGEQECVKLPDDEMFHCEEIFHTHSRTTDGNFVVTIPLKEEPSALGKSRHIAYKRLKNLEAKFARNTDFKDRYINFMREFEQSGHMTRLQGPLEGQLNFLPHHAVINYEKQTTPVRIVYDASCLTDSGLSFNDIQYKGNINQDELINLLLRFRVNSFVVCADIEKMYRMIYVNHNQRNLQCILWRENPDPPLGIYALNTLSFGLKCAPYLATRCLLQLAYDNETPFPDAAAAIATGFYIDDLIYSGNNETKMAETVNQIDCILQSANFRLRKWRSNSQVILNAVSTANTNTNTPISFGDSSSKVLGLAWCQDNDNLICALKNKPIEDQLTKRRALSILSSIFDPLGLLTPVLITGKIFIQRLFADKTGWDEVLPKLLTEEFKSFYKDIFSLNMLSVPRHVIIHDCTKVELHGFADSSLTAYGAVIYLRSIDKHGHILVRLLCSKSRIARKETIPRLELRAAVLLATLYNKVRNAIKISLNSIYLWSDSTIVLAWIKNQPSKLQCFIGNRVEKIQGLTEISNWHWVSTHDNPADLITRGLPAAGLARCPMWWQGCTWLQTPCSEWPYTETPRSVDSETENETKILCNTTVEQQSNPLVQELIAKYSSDTKLNRVLAYVLRFINNSKPSNNKFTGPLSVTELSNAINKLIQCSQVESFPNEYRLLQQNKPIPKKSNLLSLRPFIKDGLMRVGGRLGNSLYAHDKKHPAILHHKHTLTKLILRNEHERLLHAGPQLLLSAVRERLWPTHGKSLASKVVRECVKCFRANPKTTEPVMGNLPLARVTPSYPFDTTGIDYAGPFAIRDRRGRGYKCYKCYICIFVCYSTKAIHIELVTSLESQSFISALRRFIARRGKPRVLVSDNATTFIGANNELTELYTFLNTYSNDLMTFGANEGITWKFVPVYTPHMAGLHEAAVKSCKYHLKRIVSQALLTYEEFLTYLIQIEGILNSRPLCPIPTSDSDSDDIPILTPAHFLIGRSQTSLPDYDYQEVPVHMLKHFQQIQQMRRDFWRQWSRDYIGHLQQRTKWRAAKGPALSVGTVVLIKDDQLPPCHWRLGRITECHAGQDAITRVATIKTQRATIKRAFNRICVLPINDVD